VSGGFPLCFSLLLSLLFFGRFSPVFLVVVVDNVVRTYVYVVVMFLYVFRIFCVGFLYFLFV